jgi:hypothetical protein
LPEPPVPLAAFGAVGFEFLTGKAHNQSMSDIAN